MKGVVDLDGQGFITTDAALQTSAAGEGAAVALGIRRYVEAHGTGGRPMTVD